MSNKSELQSNNDDLREILDAVNELPDAGGTGGESATSGGLKMVASVTATENVTEFLITGLSAKLPISILLYNAGASVLGGARVSVNGVEKVGYTGTLTCSDSKRPGVLVWLYENINNEMQGNTLMSNSGWNVLTWPNKPDVIESIGFNSGYTNDGETNFFQNGTRIEIFEGVYPNVKA